MIIVRLVEKFPKEVKGGLIPNIFYLSKHQVEQGHKVYVFALDKKGSSKDTINDVPIFWVKKPHLVRTFGGMALLRAVKEKGIKPDIIHGLQAIPFGWLFPWAKKKIKAKYVLSVHGSIFPLKEYGADNLRDRLDSLEYSRLIRFLARKADFVLPVSDFIKRDLVFCGIPESKIKTIPTGIDFELFNKRVKIKKPDKFTVLSVGRFVQNKGLLYLIKAIHLLREEKRDVKLALVGGQKSDSDYNKILNLVKELKLQDSVDIIDPVPYHQLPSIYQSAHVFVFPSLAKGQGKVVLEAMAAGLPVVVTSEKDSPGIVKDGINGLTVPFRDEAAIAKAIKRLLKDNALRDELAKSSEQTAEKYDWKIIAERYTKIFKTLL